MNHSGHFPRIFVSLTVATLLMLGQRGGGAPAEATIIYTFTTTAPAPLAGPVSGAFSVPDSAILDGFIRAPEIISYQFVLPSAAAPFAPTTFSAPDPLTILSPFAGAMSVDPSTGTFTADSLVLVADAATSQQLASVARSLSTPRYEIGLGELPFQQFVQGDGLWTFDRQAGRGAPARSRCGWTAPAWALGRSRSQDRLPNRLPGAQREGTRGSCSVDRIGREV
jgi:hypothetical protein